MRFIFLLFTFYFSLLLASCNKSAYLFTSFHEPADAGLRMLYSYDGKNWKDLDTVLLKPQVGNQKVMRDPSMLQGPDGTFHLVWTSSWRGDKGFGYASSKDLRHWSEQQFIQVMQHEPTTVNVWAPELFYDDVEKQYIIIWASCIPGRYDRGIEEDSNNHRMYYTVTKDFKKFSDTKLFLDPGFSVIDAVIVKMADKDYVLVLKDNTRPERNLKVAFANSPLGPWTNISKPFTEQFTEGPTVYRVDYHWQISFDSYQKKIYETRMTKDFEHFTNYNDRVIFPPLHKHGTALTANKGFVNKLKKKLKKEK